MPKEYALVHVLMGRNPPVQTRVEPDTKDILERYAEDHDINQSKALRRMVHRQLDAEGYGVAATDGGATVADRLDEIESRQERSSTTHTAALVVGIGYVAVTAATGASGVLWGVVGVGALVAVVLATAARNMERGADE